VVEVFHTYPVPQGDSAPRIPFNWLSRERAPLPAPRTTAYPASESAYRPSWKYVIRTMQLTWRSLGYGSIRGHRRYAHRDPTGAPLSDCELQTAKVVQELCAQGQLDEQQQALLLRLMHTDPILAQFPLRPDYRRRLLKAVITHCEHSSTEIAEDVITDYTVALSLSEVRTLWLRHDACEPFK
jgi:hypothetical protein